MENKIIKNTELTEENLEKVTAGVNWDHFGHMVLPKIDPAQYPELTAAIVSQNRAMVAILALPLIAKGVEPFVSIFKSS